MVAYPDNSNQAISTIWYHGFKPNRDDFLALMEDIDAPRRRDRQRFLSYAARVGFRGDFTLTNMVVNWPQGFAVDAAGLMLDWSSLTFDVTQATGGQIGATEPSMSGQKVLLMLGVKHTYIEDTAVTDKKGVSRNTRRRSVVEPVVYRLAGQVADAEVMVDNASLLSMVVNAIANDGVVPLAFVQRRHGVTSLLSSDVVRYERYIYTSADGSVSAQNEEASLARAFASTGRVLTSNGQVAFTKQAISGSGGQVQLTGGEKVDLSVGVVGADGAYRQFGRVVRALLGQTFTLLPNQKYIVRVKVAEDGGLIAYKALTDVSYPDTSQTPSLFGVSSDGAENGAFWSTARDIALLEVQSGDAGTEPVVTPLATTAFSHLFHLLSSAYFENSDATLGDVTAMGDVDIRGTLTIQDVTEFQEDVTINDGFSLLTRRIAHPDGNLGSLEIVGESTMDFLTALNGITSRNTVRIEPILGAASLRGEAPGGMTIRATRDETTISSGESYLTLEAHGNDAQGSGERASVSIFGDGDQGGTSFQVDLSSDGAVNKRPVLQVGKEGTQTNWHFYAGANALQEGRKLRSVAKNLSATNMASLEGDGVVDVFASGNLNLDYAAIGGEVVDGEGVLSLFSNPTGSARVKGAQLKGNVLISNPVPAAVLSVRRNAGNNTYDIYNNVGFNDDPIDDDISDNQGFTGTRLEVKLEEDLGADCTVIVSAGSLTVPLFAHGFITSSGGTSYVTVFVRDATGADKVGSNATGGSTINIAVWKTGLVQ